MTQVNTRKIRGHGEGSVYPRKRASGARYWATRWTYLDADGVARRGYKAFDSKQEALSHLRKVAEAIETKTYVPPSKLTVEAYLRKWMAGTTFQDLAPQTQRGYRRHVEQIIPRIGNVLLTSLTGVDLDEMYAELLVSGSHTLCCKKGHPCGSHLGASGLSKTTVRQYHATLCAALRVAVKARLVAHAVTKDASPPSPSAAKAQRQGFQTWTAEEVATFLRFSRDTPQYPIWHFLLTTGCRRGEALGLRWSDVDFDTNTATIVQTVGVTEDAQGQRRVILQNAVKGGVGHTIALDAGTMAVLRAQRSAYREDRVRFRASWIDSGLVFYRGMGTKGTDRRRSHSPGAPLDGEWISSRWREQVLAAHAANEELKIIRLHDARHTWATLALKNGVPTKVVQERLNHKHASITQSIYQHTTPGMDRDAAELIASLFSQASGMTSA